MPSERTVRCLPAVIWAYPALVLRLELQRQQNVLAHGAEPSECRRTRRREVGV